MHQSTAGCGTINFSLLLLLPLFTTAQKLPSIEEKTNGLKKYEGYFTFYWDENTGKVWAGNR